MFGKKNKMRRARLLVGQDRLLDFPINIEQRKKKTSIKKREAYIMAAWRFVVSVNEGQTPHYVKLVKQLKAEIEKGKVTTVGGAKDCVYKEGLLDCVWAQRECV